MNKIEVTKLLNRIKTHYPFFNIADYVVDEWLKYLRKYDNYDVNKKLDDYIEDEKDRAPTVAYITKYLKTPEEKAKFQNSEYVIRCNLCQKEMPLSVYNNEHFDKCSSINYLLMIMKAKGITVEYDDLETLDYRKFERVYEKYKDWS